MDSPHSIPVLPPDIIDILMSKLAHDKKYDMMLTRGERRDLAACGLASSSFYLHSRHYLFAAITINIDLCEPLSQEIRLNRSGLVEILSGNPVIQEQVRHLVITYMDSQSDPCSRPIGHSGTQRGDNLQAIVRLLPALRKLTITSSRYGYRAVFNGDVASVLQELNLLCPHLQRLSLSRLIDVPVQFIYTWTNIKDLNLHDVFLSEWHEDGSEEEEDDESNDNHIGMENQGVGGADAPSLEKLRLYGEMYLPDGLRKSLRQLRYLQLAINRRARNLAMPDVVHLFNKFNKVSSRLSRLSLKDFANEEWLELISHKLLTTTKVLEIIETNNKEESLFPGLMILLKPAQSITISSIQSLSITVNGTQDNMANTLYHQGWSELDVLWAGPQYQYLQKLDIRLISTYTDSDKAILRIKDKAQALMHNIENWSYSLLPLVSSSSNIDFNFTIELHSLTRYIAWNNHSGTASNFDLNLHRNL